MFYFEEDLQKQEELENAKRASPAGRSREHTPPSRCLVDKQQASSGYGSMPPSPNLITGSPNAKRSRQRRENTMTASSFNELYT